MSNRFHNKWHRHNHHTYPAPNEPDSSHDPIASPADPFKGDFVLAGALSASAPLSAFAGYFSSNNTALCAIGGNTGIYAYGSTYGIHAKGISNDEGNIRIDDFGNSNISFPVMSNPAIYAEGNVLFKNALSANSIWVTNLYAVSSILETTDMHLTELSGFRVKGTDYERSIPTTFNPTTQQGVTLDGVGVTGTSWASFYGDLKTFRDLYVADQAFITNDTQSKQFIATNDGTQSAAAFTFLNDTDTGIYSPADNELSITTAGTQRVTIKSTGRVGIGTSSPDEELTVSGDIKATQDLYANNAYITNSLTANSAVVNYLDVKISEQGGFKVEGNYTGLTIPDTAQAADNLLMLEGVGLSAANYAVFDGDTAIRKLFITPRDSTNDTILYKNYRGQFLDAYYPNINDDTGYINLNLGANNSRHLTDSAIYGDPISGVNLYFGAQSDVNLIKFWSRNWNGFGDASYPWSSTAPELSSNDNITGKNYGFGYVSMLIDGETGNVGIGIPGTQYDPQQRGGGPGPGEGLPNERLTVYGNISASGTIYATNANVNFSTTIPTGTTTINSTPSTPFNSAFYKLVLINGTNIRASNVTVAWSSAGLTFNETSTTDVGTTSGISLSAGIVGSNIVLQGVVSSGSWEIRGSKIVL